MLERRLALHHLRVEADPDVLAVLAPLLLPVSLPVPAVGTLRYAARPVAGRWEVLEEGDHLTWAPTAADAADAVYLRAHRRAFERASLAGWVRLHAATADVEGRRALLVGRSGVGKTTLALALAVAGHDVHGDESVLVRAGASLAVPRPFHVKAGTWDVLPDLPVARHDLPRVGDVSILDPQLLGRAPESRVAPVDAVVLLERAGAPVAASPVSTAEVIDALVRDAFVVTESSAALLRTVVAAVGGARRLRLAVGEPAATVGELREALCYLHPHG